MRGLGFAVGLFAAVLFWVGVESASAGTRVLYDQTIYTNNTPGGNMTTISGLAWTTTGNILAGYNYNYYLSYQSSATTAGICIGLDGMTNSAITRVSIRQAAGGVDSTFEEIKNGVFGPFSGILVCSASVQLANTVYGIVISGSSVYETGHNQVTANVYFRAEAAGTITINPGGAISDMGSVVSVIDSLPSTGSVAWNDVTGKPSTFPPDSHNHDDRYWTESESDARFSAAAHLHDSVYCNADGTESDPDCASGGDGGGAVAPCDTVECLPASEFDDYVLASHTCGDPNADPPQDPCEVGLAINDSNALQDIRETNGYLLGALAAILVLSILLWTFLRAGNDPE